MKILRISYPTYSDVFYKFHLHFPGIKLFNHYVLYCVWIKHLYWYSVFRDSTAVQVDLSTCVFVLPCNMGKCCNSARDLNNYRTTNIKGKFIGAPGNYFVKEMVHWLCASYSCYTLCNSQSILWLPPTCIPGGIGPLKYRECLDLKHTYLLCSISLWK